MHIFLLFLLIGLYVYVCFPRNESFVTTGFQLTEDLKINISEKVNYIIIIPYFLGMNKLNWLSEKINKLDTSLENVYVFVVDIENTNIVLKTTKLLSSICPDIIDLNNQPILLIRQKNPISRKYLFRETNDIVLLHKINKLLFQLNKE